MNYILGLIFDNFFFIVFISIVLIVTIFTASNYLIKYIKKHKQAKKEEDCAQSDGGHYWEYTVRTFDYPYGAKVHYKHDICTKCGKETSLGSVREESKESIAKYKEIYNNTMDEVFDLIDKKNKK